MISNGSEKDNRPVRGLDMPKTVHCFILQTNWVEADKYAEGEEA